MELSADALASVPVMCPPLDDQRRIADFLDTETTQIDALRTARHAARNLLLERRAANVFSLVTGDHATDRRPSNLAWATTLPVAWPSVKLGRFARMGSGHTPSRTHPEWWEDCTIPWITTGEVSQVRNDRREVLTETRERISKIGMANSAAELHPKGTVILP
jgi:type I restriction enzyme S subunit